MNYADFKNYIVNSLWKIGDATVINALDTLIATANAELDKVLKVVDRDVTAAFPITGNLMPLPPDYKAMRSLSIPNGGETLFYKYVLPSVILMEQAKFTGTQLPIYSTTGGNLLTVTGASVSIPINSVLVYTSTIPDYKTTDASWVADNFFDVYLYCVLKHTAPFLREDERVSMWNGYYKEALNAALIDNDDVQYSGSPLEIIFS